MSDDELETVPSSLQTSDAPNNITSSYDELRLGVWRILLWKESRLSMFSFRWENFTSNVALLRRAIRDVYTISPRLFTIHVLVQLWSAIETPLSLHFSNRLFFCINQRLSGGFVTDPTAFDLYRALISRVACSAFSTYMGWYSRQNKNAYSSLIKYEFEARLFSASLSSDLPTLQDAEKSNAHVGNVYRCVDQGTSVVGAAISFLLHIRLITNVVGDGLNNGGPLFTALCMLPFLVGRFRPVDLWEKGYITDAANEFFIRKCSLAKLAESDLKQEVMAGGMSQILTNEYRKAKDGLGDTPDTGPEFLYSEQSKAILDTITTLCSNAPTFFFVFMAIIDPSKFSIAQLAMLQQTSDSLRYAFSELGWCIDQWLGDFSRMRDLYDALEPENKMKDGETPFPRPGYEASAGMGIEVKDLSFSYPGSKSERASLTGASFAIQPGQLVVIVGANGSGKSTIIKLLSRFYDRTSGTIHIDGLPIEEYKMDELRKGIAMLTQDHNLFPLSIEDNIKLGSSDAEVMNDEQKLTKSVIAAGADGLVKNFSDGYDTVLKPVVRAYLSHSGRGNKELEAIHKKMKKSASISGGEKQKLVAARTFMRLFTSPVKLVTVDEPSSALDPEAEYQLFTNLMEERKGRTMIFVTHRFGHLTKHADLIICFKEGTSVESGTHADLMAKGGEYANLYNIQAQAFTTT